MTAGRFVTETLDHDGGREVTVHLPPHLVTEVVYAADGGWHVERLAARLESAGRHTTLLVGVHGMPDDDGRLHEYVCGFDPERFEAHERFFVVDVPAWVHTIFDVALPAERTAAWGASLGAELALAMGMRHPDRIGVVLAASPGAGYRPPVPLPEALPRAYLVAGTEEEFFLENAKRWASALGDGGTDAVLVERPGTHGGDFWFEELASMLAWAFDGS